MKSLFRGVWPFLRWSLFGAFLALVGVAMHRLFPPQPRWAVEGVIGKLLLGGSRWAAPFGFPAPGEAWKHQGPLKIWDTQTGRLVRAWLGEGALMHYQSVSPDRRFLA